MKVTAQINAKYEDKGNLKALAQICLGSSFLVTGIRVIEGKNGLCVFMPSRQLRSGEYKDICFPLTKELYSQIRNTVLEAYDNGEVIRPETAEE